MSSSPFVDAPPNDWDIPDDIGLKKKKKTPQEKAKAREERAKKEQIKKQQATIKQPISFLGNINWMALTFLAMFVVPGILAVCIQGYDMMYPGAAQERVLREKLVRCYEVANPTKLNDIDDILKKANKRYTKLLAGLKNKYGEKYVQCNIGTYEFD